MSTRGNYYTSTPQAVSAKRKWEDRKIVIDSDEFTKHLKQGATFTYEASRPHPDPRSWQGTQGDIEFKLTCRGEKRKAGKEGVWYYSAYFRDKTNQDKKLHKIYLGRHTDITQEKLTQAIDKAYEKSWAANHFKNKN